MFDSSCHPCRSRSEFILSSSFFLYLVYLKFCEIKIQSPIGQFRCFEIQLQSINHSTRLRRLWGFLINRRLVRSIIYSGVLKYRNWPTVGQKKGATLFSTEVRYSLGENQGQSWNTIDYIAAQGQSALEPFPSLGSSRFKTWVPLP